MSGHNHLRVDTDLKFNGDDRAPVSPQSREAWESAPASPSIGGTSFPKNKIKILLMEGISQSAVDVFAGENFQVECVHKLTPEELAKKIEDVHVIGVRSKTKLTKTVLQNARRLLAVGCFCIGTDQTDLDYCAEIGVPVFNSPFCNTRSVAEMIIAELIMLSRQMGDRNKECHNGFWNKTSGNCFEVRGKTLGIIGYGHVGTQLSVLAESLGFRVIFYDVVSKLPLGNARACDSLDELLQKADYVTLHVPGGKETKNLISAPQIALMKKGSYLLNASRGEVVDVDAAAAALKSGHLAGGAFDVFPYEPASSAEKFVTPVQNLNNVILTPHIGGSTEEAQTNIGVDVANKLVSFINTGNTFGSVNFPEVVLAENKATHRLLNVHKNVPGVLRDINTVLSQYNVTSQVLRTSGHIGYLIVEIDKAVSRKAQKEIQSLPTSVRTRILF